MMRHSRGSEGAHDPTGGGAELERFPGGNIWAQMWTKELARLWELWMQFQVQWRGGKGQDCKQPKEPFFFQGDETSLVAQL